MSVASVMEGLGIPKYIWYPIMMSESEGNPNNQLSNQHEDSRGLFQINIKANPAFAKYDLYNEDVNAEIAGKYFIKPALDYAKNRTDNQLEQLLITYSGLRNPDDVEGKINYGTPKYIPEGGIRPYWTYSLKDKITGYYNSLISTSSSVEGGSGIGEPYKETTTPSNEYKPESTFGASLGVPYIDKNTQESNIDLNLLGNGLVIFIIMLIVIVAGLSIFKMVGGIKNGWNKD